MECLNEAILTRQRDHYHSQHCKTCEYCHLTAAFPRPWVDKPGDPVDYFQDYTPHCLVCRYANEWLFDETLEEGEEHSSMEYKNRVEISHKLYKKLDPLAKLDRVIFVADVGKFKNMELLNLYWNDHNRMDDVVQMEIDIGGGYINITVSNEQLDLHGMDAEKEYWHRLIRMPHQFRQFDGAWSQATRYATCRSILPMISRRARSTQSPFLGG